MLNRTFGCVRVVWNRTLAARHARWQQSARATSYAETDAALTLLKKDPDLAFLSEVSSVPLQQALRHQHRRSPRSSGNGPLPAVQVPASRQTAHYTRRAFTMRRRGAAAGQDGRPAAVHLVLAGPGRGRAGPGDGGRVPGTGRPLVRDLRHRNRRPRALEPAGHAVGVDLGVTDLAVTSDGEKIANPRYLARKARNLARYQRRLARCRKGSANRAKAKAKVARAHRKVRNARSDFLHRASTRLVRSADMIVIEDLNVSGMVRNRRLARAISDCGWGEFRRQLAYKCERACRRPDRDRPLVPVVQDLLGMRAPARGAEPGHAAVDVPVLRRPARPGPQRRDEHPGRWSSGDCLRSWRRHPGTSRVRPP